MRYTRILPVALSLCAMSARAQGDVSCPTGSEDIRIAALSGLAQLESDQLLPVMKKILERRDSCSAPLRRQVVGFLQRTRFGEQADLLLGVARTDPSGDVRRYAVQVLAAGNSERAVSALDSIVFTSTDVELRDAALRGLAQTSVPAARASLRRAAEQGSLPMDLRARAVSLLGSTRRSGADDTQYLVALYARAEHSDLRDATMRAIASQRNPEATSWLLGMARDRNRDIDTRRQALSYVGQVVRANESVSVAGIDLNALIGLYDSFAGQVEMQDRALDVIAQRPETAATDKLLLVARTEPNMELRRKAVLRVGQRRDPRVREFLMEVLSR